MYQSDTIKNAIRLNANELTQKIDTYFLEKILSAVDLTGFNRYPETHSETLVQTYSNFLNLPSSQVIAGNGSDEIIDIIFKTFISPGDTVMSFSPSFVMYPLMCGVFNANYIPYTLKNYTDFNIDSFIEAINQIKPKLIFICNPNNPTGLLISPDQIKHIIKTTDAYVVIDEAYGEFIGKNYLDYSMMPYVNDFKRVIVLKTLSKAYGLAGLRVGFGISNDAIIQKMAQKKHPYNISLFSQQFATELILNINEAFFQNRISETITQRIVFIENLKIFTNITVFPSSANFVWLYCETVDLKNVLVAHKIQIRAFDTPELKGYYRISIGNSDEMSAVITTLKEVLL